MSAIPPIIHVMPPEPYGGLQALVIELARAQQKAGQTVGIILLDESSRVEARCVAAGIKAVTLSGSKVSRIRDLRRELRRQRGAIFHSHCEPIWAAPVLAAERSAWVAHLHVYPTTDFRNGAINLTRRLLARRFIAISHSIADAWMEKRLAPSRRVGVVHNGIDLDKFPAPSEVREGPFTVTFLGRAEREKGLFDVIEVADRLRELSNLRFVIAGEGSDLGEARAVIVAKGLEDKISVLGFVSNPQEVLRSSDLLLMLSAREPFGLVIIEAIACGAAVLGYDTLSGGSEVMATLRGCAMVEPFDLAALANSIRESAADTRLRRRALFGREILAQKYSISRMAEDITAQYRRAGLA